MHNLNNKYYLYVSLQKWQKHNIKKKNYILAANTYDWKCWLNLSKNNLKSSNNKQDWHLVSATVNFSPMSVTYSLV